MLRRRPGSGCSSRSARRRASPRSIGAYGLVHDSSRWKNGQRRNMPPGSSSAEIDRVGARRGGAASTRPGGRPGRCRRRRPGSRRAGTAASLSSATGSRSGAGAPRPGASGTSPVGWPIRKALDRGAGQDQAAQRRRARRRRRPAARRAGSRPRRRTRPGRAWRAPRRRPGPSIALEDHVEAGAGQALAEDPLALREPALLEGVGDRLELRRREVREQREPGDRVDDLVRSRHRSASLEGARDRGRGRVFPLPPAFCHRIRR